jgi:hypothetical protein
VYSAAYVEPRKYNITNDAHKKYRDFSKPIVRLISAILPKWLAMIRFQTATVNVKTAHWVSSCDADGTLLQRPIAWHHKAFRQMELRTMSCKTL